MIENKTYEDVFEAIRCLEPSSPILNLKDRSSGYLIRNPYFQAMELPDGTIGAFPPSPNMGLRLYRGENDNFDLKYPCVPSIYRANNCNEKGVDGHRDENLILIDELKVLEFELVAKMFPQVSYAIEDCCNVDFRALAQHYGLNTDIVDLSSDIAVAAFFSTNAYYANEGFFIKSDGVGCLRVYANVMSAELESDGNLHLTGLQPFIRPGVQAAFGIKLEKGVDFSHYSAKVIFKQVPKWNRILQKALCPYGQNMLFPDEEISHAANKIMTSNTISDLTVNKFCERHNYAYEKVKKILSNYNMNISHYLAYSLDDQQTRKLEKEFKGRPYGDVKIISRLAAY